MSKRKQLVQGPAQRSERLTTFLSLSALTDQVAVGSVGTSEQGYMSSTFNVKIHVQLPLLFKIQDKAYFSG